MTMRANYVITTVLVAGLLIGWLVQAGETRRLRAELSLARERQAELAGLREEQRRLQAQQPSAAQLAELQATLDARSRLERELEQRTVERSQGLHYGEWMPHKAWQNRGAATPRAAVESALWAAAGGDVQALAALIELDPIARERAAALHEAMPAETRRQYATPDALLASLTLPKIPCTEAQLVWSHVADDRASIGVMLQPEPPVAPPAAGTSPSLRRLVTLSLHRTEQGWRLVLPAKAVDRLATALMPRSSGAAP